MARDTPTASALLRSLKLGSLVGRVGTSMVGNRLMEIGRSDDEKARQRADALIRNAHRVVESLGKLKGAAMKVGQMLSLQEGLLPPEVAEVLRSLQQQAPRVPAEVMRFEVEGALGSFDRHFEWMEDEAHAAASIGQVFRARLVDGRDVAVKIQYPLIDEIVRADLKNLKVFFGALFAMLSEVDFEPLWNEVRDRLVEELDYTIEAANMKRMAELHSGVSEVVIPGVVDEASARTVLTMEYVDGLSADEACSEKYPQELRDVWGQNLLDLQFRGLLKNRALHADPNLANFAFREDGSVVMYDFGCVKNVPEVLVRGYAELLLAVLVDRWSDVPDILVGIGVFKGDGEPISVEISDAYAGVLSRIVRKDPPYAFGEDDLSQDLVDLGFEFWSEALDMQFPSDAVFVNRAFAGHVGNLSRLGSRGPWREIIRKYAEEVLNAP